MPDPAAPILVGVDGSPSAATAVRWAAAQAARERRPLHLLHASLWPLLRHPPARSGPAMRARAEAIVSDAVAESRAAEPGLDVHGLLADGDPGTVLVHRSEGAALIVVGSRGLGGFAGLLLGSVGVHLAGHARCPVAVVRGDADATGPVVVGVDGSTGSAAALRWAVAEAERRGTTAVAVHAWSLPSDVEYAGSGDVDALRTAAAHTLEAAVRDTPAQPRLVEGGVAAALLDTATGASLLVLGARGRGGFPGLALGGATHALLHHAPCPVVVVRGSTE